MKNNLKSCGIVILTLILVIIILTILISLPRSSRPQTPADLETGAWYACREFIEDDLKAPSTASFELRNSANITQENENTFTVRMSVDAENSFGVMVRTDFRCRVRHTTGDQWLLLSLTTP